MVDMPGNRTKSPCVTGDQGHTLRLSQVPLLCVLGRGLRLSQWVGTIGFNLGPKC